MSKRLQVLMDERELAEIRQAAASEGQTLSEWARQALRDRARDAVSPSEVARRLAIVEASARHEFPTADIEQMLEEIERGYLESADR